MVAKSQNVSKFKVSVCFPRQKKRVKNFDNGLLWHPKWCVDSFLWFVLSFLFFSFSLFRVLHVGELFPACCGSSCSAAAADAERKRHTLCPVQLLPVQSWWPQSRGLASVCAGERRSTWESGVEHLGVSRQTVAPGWVGSQHLLAEWIPGMKLVVLSLMNYRTLLWVNTGQILSTCRVLKICRPHDQNNVELENVT